MLVNTLYEVFFEGFLSENPPFGNFAFQLDLLPLIGRVGFFI
ncbi:hypothetical protein DFQ04_1429 [Algoriphagus boseongensis]|uniref:Uncharacterized protein n=1 Tax=Algoriphagus boseongensis TaxID=1442587 RepID=A0A4R6TCZ3_9BACT|nr:hypothetical protein DFQ04_1429 [Algoriphagus boseongensis]